MMPTWEDLQIAIEAQTAIVLDGRRAQLAVSDLTGDELNRLLTTGRISIVWPRRR